MLEDGVNNLEGEAPPSIDPPDNGGPGISGLSSAVEEAIGDPADEAIDPPDNG